MSGASADDLIQQGIAASQADDAQRALALFGQAAALVPSLGLPHFLIGAELAQLGRMEEAETSLANAVLLAPGLEWARYQLGLCQFTSGRAALALVTWSALTEPSATPMLRLAVLGFAALAQDDFTEASRCFAEAKALGAANPPFARDMQMLLERISVSTTPPPPSASSDAEPQEALHVLLSNYRNQGSMH